MSDDVTQSIREGYDHLADECARRLFRELESKRLDRKLLDRFADVAGRDACDMGCVSRWISSLPTRCSPNLSGAGWLAIEEIIEQEPYHPQIEHQTRRVYILPGSRICERALQGYLDTKLLSMVKHP
jgi:hypothetical protein